MVIRTSYVCYYCGSPRIEYKEVVTVDGISFDPAVNDSQDALLKQTSYDDGSDYCLNCEDHNPVVEAWFIYCNNQLYEILPYFHDKSCYALFSVPHTVESGGRVYFTDAPILLGEIVRNEMTESLVSLLLDPTAPEEDRHSALESLISLVEDSEEDDMQGDEPEWD